MEFFTRLLDPSGFKPPWSGDGWSAELIWIHTVSDTLIWLAYMAIPFVLIYFIRQRPDLPFRAIFWLFVAFILASGFTHLIEVVVSWTPMYRLSALVKVITAAVSWATVVALVPLTPRVLAMRSPDELQREIEQRKSAEEALLRLNAELERRVQERTAELLRANEALRREIGERKRAERRRLTRLAVTQVLAEARPVKDAARRLLQAICEGLGWTVGALWTVARQASLMRCVEVWNTPGAAVEPFVTATRKREVTRGVGLAGRVWAKGECAWIPDIVRDTNFSRSPLAFAAGLHGAFACPIILRGECLGVIEFFSKEVREPDEDLLEMMATLGNQIGQFLERKYVEEKTQQQREWLRVTLASIGDAVITTDVGGRITFMNSVAEALTGWGEQEAAGQPLQSVFRIANAETRAALETPVAQILSQGATVAPVNHTLLIDRHGHERPVDNNAAPIRDVEGNVLGVVLVFRDITERQRAEDELREADRRKDSFLATLAHELRNPLAPIRNALQILKLTDGDRVTVEQARSLMERQVEQLVRLVDDLLDVSRINRGKIQLRKEQVELATVIARAIETARPLIDEQGHELTVTLPPQRVVLEADLTRLAQVLSNLLNNAAKYTERGGHLGLTADVQDSEVVVRVRDDGVGIPAEILPHVFDMFTQSDRSLELSQGGLGIGLTLVRSLVELHGGTVAAHSGGAGQGSEFTVRLPLARQYDEGRRNGGPEVSGQTASSPGQRVLVVDDNMDAARSLALLLRLQGYEVRLAHDGPGAVDVALDFVPEVVLLDIGLPGMSGYEVCRRLRQESALQGALLIAQTGWGQEEDRRRSSEAGFDYHLVKPVDPSALQELLVQVQKKA